MHDDGHLSDLQWGRTNSFMNLTHVYGCSDIARVHADQHAIDFLVENGTALLYFANDGGVYRGLDGYTGLTTGTCGLSNQFDSLNATLGPMSQFVSVSESASDPSLIFGGTQDNGAPATAFAQSTGAWLNVNGGDDGFTAVNPSNDNEWFVATPPDSISGVNLFRCSNGVNCHSQDFQNDQIADSSAVGGDGGPFYLPFILDPQNSVSVLLGTCRIWRRPSAGGGFSALSPDFETGGSGACSGSETNLVRALAAGGVMDANGLSQVIYIGTNGEGPLIPTIPHGGHVWVTTNSDAGPASWADVTQGINPQTFPISSIALDAADPLGKTAYVAIMGFHVSHVWKTTNAGVSWTDFTANLPDAPVNSIVIDAGSPLVNGMVYVGTDVGVFASSTGTPNWAEVGPSAGQQGFLPNVAVTSIKIFSASGVKRLRAGTYGRGIWEWNLITTPDFRLNVTNNPLTVFPGQTASFVGTIYALNGYNAGVNLSCAAGGTSPPQTCSASPALLLPTPGGTAFSVNAGDNAGDYAFNVHAVGLDPLSVTHDFALTLHVIDFSLSAPSPASVSVTPRNTTAPVSFLVSGLGAFNATVTLSCSGLPAGTNCQFQPSSSVVPSTGNPVAVILTISTSTGTPTGTSQVAVTASTPGEAAKSQTLTLIVGTAPDYSLAIANSTLVGSLNVPAVFNGTLNAANGYSSAVNLSCGPGAPPSCVPNPASVTPISGGTPFTVTVSSSVSQAYSFNIVGVGSDLSAITHSAPVTFTALPSQNFDFTIVTIPPTSASVPAGQAASFSIDVNPTTGTFPSDVTFSCSKLPALTTCVFSPAHVLSGSGDSPVALTIQTTAAIPRITNLTFSTFIFMFPIAGVLWFARTETRGTRTLNSAVTLLFLVILMSCGGGLQGGGGGNGSPGTPPGTYAITITATSGTVTHSTATPLSLTVTP